MMCRHNLRVLREHLAGSSVLGYDRGCAGAQCCSCSALPQGMSACWEEVVNGCGYIFFAPRAMLMV